METLRSGDNNGFEIVRRLLAQHGREQCLLLGDESDRVLGESSSDKASMVWAC